MNPNPNKLSSAQELKPMLSHKAIYQGALRVTEQDAIVVANAGCGKTHLLVEHYFYLLTQGLDPKNLVAFTFTEKAALELRERILRRLATHPDFCQLSPNLLQAWQGKLERAFIGTIHQFCFRLLQQSSALGDRPIQILAEATESYWKEQLSFELIQQLTQKNHPSPQSTAQAFHRLLQHFGMKRLLETLEEYGKKARRYSVTVKLSLPEATTEETQLLEDLKILSDLLEQKLQDKKNQHRAFTFEDLERQALTNLSTSAASLENFLGPIQYYLVDEFQDTSPIQIEILSQLRHHSNKLVKTQSPAKAFLYCVGDPKQSIYRFRQVDQSVLAQATEEILASGGQRFDFTRNYRAVPELLEFQNQFSQAAFPESFPSQPTRASQNPSPTKPSIALVPLSSQEGKLNAEDYRQQEAQWITQKILQLKAQGQSLGEMAVLFRTAASSLPLLETLKAQGLPFTVRGGRHLLEIQAIRDCKNLLTWLTYPQDDLALLGVLRSPLFLLSDLTLYYLCRDRNKEQSLWEYFSAYFLENNQANLPQEISEHEREKFRWAYQTLSTMFQQSKELAPATFFRLWNQKLSFQALYAAIEQEPETPLALEQFFCWLEQTEPQLGQGIWLETLKLLQNMQDKALAWTPLGDKFSHPDSLQVLTIHAAKGLEFKTVFLGDLGRSPQVSQDILQQVGTAWALKLCCAQGNWEATERFKAIKDYHQEEDQLESKRLLYVALTRAADQLWIPFNARTKARGLQALLFEELPEAGKAFQLPEETTPIPAELGKAFQNKSHQNPVILEGLQEQPVEFLTQNKTRTVSELESFVTCPLKHYYSYELKLSEQPWENNALPWQQTEMGTLLHEALDASHRFPEKSRSQILKDLLLEKQLWLQEELIAQLEETLSKYQTSELYQKLTEADQDYSELAFLLTFSQGKVRGQMDRLIQQQEKWTLIDFKYTQKHKSPKELLSQYGFQLKTYALAAQQFLQGQIPLVEIHLLEQLESCSFHFTQEELQQHRQQLNKYLQNLENPQLEKVTKHRACNTCNFRHPIPLCPIPRGMSYTFG